MARNRTRSRRVWPSSRERCVSVVRRAEERDKLRASHERLRQELELLKRRIFIAKAERVDTTQLEFEFAAVLAQLKQADGTIDDIADADNASGSDGSGGTDGGGGSDDEDADATERAKPKGRRNLKYTTLPDERVEIDDPIFEQLVAEGKAERMGCEETYKLAYQRGGTRRLVIARIKYRTVDRHGKVAIALAELPPETFARSLAAPSMLAHIAHEKHGRGLPLHRIETQFRLDGERSARARGGASRHRRTRC